MGQRPQQCLLVPILVGTDGVQRMSKSLDNYIGVAESPKDTYFKVMRLNDDLIPNYLELVTDIPDTDISEIKAAMASRSVNPIEIKKRLAHDIVSQFHSTEAAASAETEFERIVQRKEADDLVTEVSLASLNAGETAFIPDFSSNIRPLPPPARPDASSTAAASRSAATGSPNTPLTALSWCRAPV